MIDDNNKRNMNVELPETIIIQAKVKAAKQDITLKKYIEMLIEFEVNSNGNNTTER